MRLDDTMMQFAFSRCSCIVIILFIVTFLFFFIVIILFFFYLFIFFLSRPICKMDRLHFLDWVAIEFERRKKCQH